MKNRTQALTRVALCLWIAAGVAACNSPESSAESDIDTEVSSESEYVSPSDFADACLGVPVVSAAEYDASAAGIHPIYVMTRDDENDNYIESSYQIPDAWKKDWEEAAQTELVACVTPQTETLAQTCEFEEDGEPTYTLEAYDTTYDVQVRVASTGELLAEDVIEAKADSDCPIFHMFTEGELVDASRATYEQSLVELAKPFVQIAEGTAASTDE